MTLLPQLSNSEPVQIELNLLLLTTLWVQLYKLDEVYSDLRVQCVAIHGRGNTRWARNEVFAVTEYSSINRFSSSISLVSNHVLDILQMDEVYLAHLFKVVIDPLVHD